MDPMHFGIETTILWRHSQISLMHAMVHTGALKDRLITFELPMALMCQGAMGIPASFNKTEPIFKHEEIAIWINHGPQ